ncbi:exonuclease 3'-5' domain-containing protein 2-like [Arctopsyche grandis]|uniref:exonuclease 3'-5' domain-containing protein 2-like n=1 Tax=Arctopsyche grandis TaxID=121162 RepID=UPI00406DA01C
MPTDPGKYGTALSPHLIVAGVTGAAGIAFALYKYKQNLLNNFYLRFRNPLKQQKIHVINTHDECQSAVQNIIKNCTEHRVLGFDCEWVTKNGTRHPIALLQLASHDGFCALIRLSKIQHVPSELRVLLEDATILKVGVAAIDDAKYLLNDYSVKVNGIIDLRHLATLVSEKPEGLSSLAAKHLNVKMDKDWRIRCSDWESNALSNRQMKYAADDAHVGVELFKVFIYKILRQNYGASWFSNYVKYWKEIETICKQFLNVRFTYKKTAHPEKGKNINFTDLLSKQQKDSLKNPNKLIKRNYSLMVRSKVVYENCYMQTADGETLCTCDRKKAEWYVEKQLADMVCEDPFTIQLRFEPAGRSVGEVGSFYKNPRKKACVVCGSSHSYLKKNVVPKEYRRFFPAIMKDHSCHDVLLMCLDCHQLSNMRDQLMRTQLANMCNAPIMNSEQPKIVEDHDIKKLRSAARALLITSSKHNIPAERKLELEKYILKFFPSAEEITEDLLLSACDLEHRTENSLYESHGKIVVDYFIQNPGGLLELEKMWREYFLESMSPQFMPEFWSVTHTKSRLEIRISEGRVDKQDLEIAGIISDTIQTDNVQLI